MDLVYFPNPLRAAAGVTAVIFWGAALVVVLVTVARSIQAKRLVLNRVTGWSLVGLVFVTRLGLIEPFAYADSMGPVSTLEAVRICVTFMPGFTLSMIGQAIWIALAFIAAFGVVFLLVAALCMALDKTDRRQQR